MLNISDIYYRKLLLFIPKEKLETSLQLEIGNLLYKIDDQKIDKIPLSSLLAIFLCGKFTISSDLLKGLLENGVSLFFLKNNFENYASCLAETRANYLLRQKQYLLSKKEELKFAKDLIDYKITNQIKALVFFKKEIFNKPEIFNVKNDKSLLGIEGFVSSNYFTNLFNKMDWYKRLPQAKPDEINLLMDIGYTMLFNLTDAMLSLFGFDTYKGFYHKLFFARKSLASDIMEPARPIIDGAILMMFRRNIFIKKDFKIKNRSYEFNGEYKTKLKYAKYFIKTLAIYKEDLFIYIRQFYFALSIPEKYKFKNLEIDFSKLPESL